MATQPKKTIKKRKAQVGSAPPYPFETRLKVGRLHVEDGYPAPLLSQQFGMSDYSVYRWSKRYRLYGEQGLMDRPRKPGGSKLPLAVTENIVELKKQNPSRGARRISDILKRFFLVGSSPSTVQRTLHEQGLTSPVKRKPKKNPVKPRFFERARPNQMWQSDILSFRLAGKNAYLIGYLDDYSRYITALELALRGEPRDPFYMVGRMGDQSVVIRAEKGQVKMLVDDQKELVYDATKGADDESQTNPKGVRPETKDNRRTVHLDGAKEHISDLRRDAGQLDAGRPVAEPGHGGDACSLVAESNATSPKQLNPRLVQLIDKKLQGGNLVKLEKRLKTIQKKAN